MCYLEVVSAASLPHHFFYYIYCQLGNNDITIQSKECERETVEEFTQTQKEIAEQKTLKSAITDYCRRNNHIIDWDKSRIVTSESNKLKHWIKEAMRSSSTINRDDTTCKWMVCVCMYVQTDCTVLLFVIF